METVQVTLNIPKAEKDVVDAIVIAYQDFKAQKGSLIIADELPSIIKIAGELGELMVELKSKQSVAALGYLAQQIAGV